MTFANTLVLKRWQDLTLTEQTVVRQLGISEQQSEYAGTIDRALEHCQAGTDDDVAGDGDEIRGEFAAHEREEGLHQRCSLWNCENIQQPTSNNQHPEVGSAVQYCIGC